MDDSVGSDTDAKCVALSFSHGVPNRITFLGIFMVVYLLFRFFLLFELVQTLSSIKCAICSSRPQLVPVLRLQQPSRQSHLWLLFHLLLHQSPSHPAHQLHLRSPGIMRQNFSSSEALCLSLTCFQDVSVFMYSWCCGYILLQCATIWNTNHHAIGKTLSGWLYQRTNTAHFVPNTADFVSLGTANQLTISATQHWQSNNATHQRVSHQYTNQWYFSCYSLTPSYSFYHKH